MVRWDTDSMRAAAELERIVLDQLRVVLQTPEVIVRTWKAARKLRKDIGENEVREALTHFDELWAELFPAEQARIARLLIARIDLNADRIDIALKVEGLISLTAELTACTDTIAMSTIATGKPDARTRRATPALQQAAE